MKDCVRARRYFLSAPRMFWEVESVAGVSDKRALDAKKVRAPSYSQEDARVRRQRPHEKSCWNGLLRAEREIDTG